MSAVTLDRFQFITGPNMEIIHTVYGHHHGLCLWGTSLPGKVSHKSKKNLQTPHRKATNWCALKGPSSCELCSTNHHWVVSKVIRLPFLNRYCNFITVSWNLHTVSASFPSRHQLSGGCWASLCDHPVQPGVECCHVSLAANGYITLTV